MSDYGNYVSPIRPSGYPAIDADERRELEVALRRACAWLTDVAQIKGETLTVEKNTPRHRYASWRGAIRGEYSSDRREWDFFAPVWHTGQAIKALVLASRALGDASLLGPAELAASFIGGARVNDPNDPDHGLILAFENGPTGINTSAILEAVDGLFLLSEATGRSDYKEWALAAVRWVGARMYRGAGLFDDCYEFSERRIVPGPWLANLPDGRETRPLIDDGIFLKAYRESGDGRMRTIFLETAERLLQEEEPAGNWIRFVPCRIATGIIHPRHAYWWGHPLLAAHDETGDARFLECAIRAGEWYLNAMRTDGGLFRNTTRDFRTPSFGHENSGICCAIILWNDLWQRTADERWAAAIRTALRFCRQLQFSETSDPNLTGALLERVRPPDGTDRSPFELRDLGTIFYAQAISRLLISSSERGE